MNMRANFCFRTEREIRTDHDNDATMRNLEFIGESATHIPEHVCTSAHQTPWRMLIATRNRLIHGYHRIDNDTIWSIVRGDDPTLPNALQKLRNDLRK